MRWIWLLTLLIAFFSPAVAAADSDDPNHVDDPDWSPTNYRPLVPFVFAGIGGLALLLAHLAYFKLRSRN